MPSKISNGYSGLHSPQQNSRMKKIELTLVLLVLMHVAAFSQKVTYSNGIVMVGNTVACRVDVVGSPLAKSYSFRSKDDKELVYFKRRIMRSPEMNETTGTQETFTYFEIIIKGVECIAEIGENELGFALMSETKTIRKLAEYLFNDPVIVEDAIDLDAAEYFCKKMGAPYTETILRLEYTYQQPVEIVQ